MALALLAGRAGAMTADGALMTNSALATFMGIAGPANPYSVSYIATSNVLVCATNVQLFKSANPTMERPGATVTFTVCVKNTSMVSSAFNVRITDALPGWMAYATPPGWTFWETTTGPNWTASYATTYFQNPYTAGQPINGWFGPNYWLRWTGTVIGPGKSACMIYTAVIQ